MAEHPIEGMMGTTIEKIREMVDANTVIGEPIRVDPDITIIPVSRVSFGFASGGSDVGASSSKQMFGGASGAGVSVTPLSFLVISGGDVKNIQMIPNPSALDGALVNLPDMITKVVSMVKKGDRQENRKNDKKDNKKEENQE